MCQEDIMLCSLIGITSLSATAGPLSPKHPRFLMHKRTQTLTLITPISSERPLLTSYELFPNPGLALNTSVICHLMCTPFHPLYVSRSRPIKLSSSRPNPNPNPSFVKTKNICTGHEAKKYVWVGLLSSHAKHSPKSHIMLSFLAQSR